MAAYEFLVTGIALLSLGLIVGLTRASKIIPPPAGRMNPNQTNNLQTETEISYHKAA